MIGGCTIHLSTQGNEMTTLLNTVSDADLLNVIKLLRAANALLSLSNLVANYSGMNQSYLLSFSLNHPSIFSGYLENTAVYGEDLHKAEHIAFGENFKHKLLITHFIPRLRLVSMNEEIQTYSPRQLENEMIKRGLKYE
jgi:hypothetical protein